MNQATGLQPTVVTSQLELIAARGISPPPANLFDTREAGHHKPCISPARSNRVRAILRFPLGDAGILQLLLFRFITRMGHEGRNNSGA